MTEHSNTHVSLVDVKANELPIRQDVKKLYNIAVTTANSLRRPSEKRAYVGLAPDCDALDIAYKNGII